MSPRWSKVWRDLAASKLRTVLVVLSIAVGLFAFGTVTQTFISFSETLGEVYARSDPPSATLAMSAFDDSLVQTVDRIPGVASVEPRGVVSVRMQVGREWKRLILYTLPDFNNIRLDKVYFQGAYPPMPSFHAERGTWPPPAHAAILERSSLLMPGLVPARLKEGDVITVQAPNERYYPLQIAGLAYQPGSIPAMWINMAYGYITPETQEWLTGSRQFNQLHIGVTDPKLDQNHIREVVEQVRKKIEKSGRTVTSSIPVPGRYLLQDMIGGLLLVLNALGLMALFLSGFLVVNTITALMGQQIRQIGLMKAIGGRGHQIAGMYLGTALLFGVLALAVAIPLTLLTSRQTIQYVAIFANLDSPASALSPDVVIAEIGLGLLVPVLAAIIPVVTGTRITVREAIADYGIGQDGARSGWIDRGLEQVRSLPRPLLLSLRNTFRRKPRLLLTVTTLALAGVMFITVFSLRASMLLTLDEAMKNFRFDVLLFLTRPYRNDLLEQEVLKVPGVTTFEPWGYALVRRVRTDNSESDEISLFAPPVPTAMLEPTILSGRWLVPGDENAVVIGTNMLRGEPNIRVDDDIVLKIKGKEHTWHVVGIARVIGQLGAGVGALYVNYPYYARVTGQVGRASTVGLLTTSAKPAFQAGVQKQLEDYLASVDVRVGSGLTTGLLRQQNEFYFDIIVALLFIMAILMAIVGGLGLAGTMMLNVLDRTREIGVMRAIGASNGALRQIVLFEGTLIGWLSAILACLAAFPIGQFLSERLGVMIFQLPLSYSFSLDSILFWIVFVTILSAASCFLPARRALHMTVKQALAYE